MTADRTSKEERIVCDPAILVGKPTIRGTRVSVELILEYLANNPNFDDFFADYPELTMADVQAALAYARDAVGGERVTPMPPRRNKDHSVRQAV